LEAKNSNELTNYSLNIPNPPHPFNQKIPPPSQNNFIYSTPPPPPISNYAPFTTSYPTPSSILFYDKKTSITSFPPSVPATPAQSIIPIKNLIPPPLLSFPIIPDNNNNNNNTINGVYLPPFDPIINTNFLIPNSNNIISPIEKGINKKKKKLLLYNKYYYIFIYIYIHLCIYSFMYIFIYM